MLLKSSTVQLAQPIENDDEIFLLHCGEAKAFMGRGCYHGLNHTLGEMYTRVRDKKRLEKVGNLVKNSYLYR